MLRNTAITLLALAFAAHAAANTLEVGPGKMYPTIIAAYAKAGKGDVIKVYPQKNGAAYDQVAIWANKPNITFLGVPSKPGERIKICGKGFNYSGTSPTPRAIFQFDIGADNNTLEGFELYGAHNDSHNGAGVRIDQANHVTVRNCEVHNNDMGTQSNGPIGLAVDQLFENCLYHHNGDPTDAGQNHNFYLGGTSVTLRGCELHSPLTGHNFKSRAHVNWIEFCYIHDSLNREFDLVDSAETTAPESHSVLIGNVIVKSPSCANHDVIQFGQDGGKEHHGTLYLVHNTVLASGKSMFIDLSAGKTGVRMYDNIIDGGGTFVNVRNGADMKNVTCENNWIAGSFNTGGFNRGNTVGKPGAKLELTGHGDFHLRHTPNNVANGGTDEQKWDLPAPPYGKNGPSLASSKPMGSTLPKLATEGPAGARFLSWQYKDPAQFEPRPPSKKPDLGAHDLSHRGAP